MRHELGKLNPGDPDYARIASSFGAADLEMWCEWRRGRRGSDDPLLIQVEAELRRSPPRLSQALRAPATARDATLGDAVADAVERELRRAPLNDTGKE